VVDEFLIVLVIEDDKFMRKSAIEALNAYGIAGLGAADAAEALRLVEDTPAIKILLSDINVGPISGPEIVRQALKMRPDLKIIFMTGGSNTVPFRRTDPVLMKPFKMEELRTVIEHVLTARAPAEQRPPASERRRHHIG
jgi:DNA-binding NtrC family response regulator